MLTRRPKQLLDHVFPMIDSVGHKLLRPPAPFSRYTNHGSRSRREVALTFDDGPSDPSTSLLLDVLDRRGVNATFFCVGSMAAQHPDLVRRAHERGDVIANHSMHHSRGAAVSPRGADHIEESASTLRDIVGSTPALYRPPWGWLTPWEARRVSKRQMAPIGWDVYPDDWMLPEMAPEILTEQVTSRVQPGSIVLMHDGRAVYPDCAKTNTAESVDMIIERLTDDGYSFVTVPEMLGIDAYVNES